MNEFLKRYDDPNNEGMPVNVVIPEYAYLWNSPTYGAFQIAYINACDAYRKSACDSTHENDKTLERAETALWDALGKLAIPMCANGDSRDVYSILTVVAFCHDMI